MYEEDMDYLEDLGIENEYLTSAEVQSLLYIGKNTFYRLVKSGELKAFRIGKLWRVSRKSLEEYCRSSN